jgi:hypothetical protein
MCSPIGWLPPSLFERIVYLILYWGTTLVPCFSWRSTRCYFLIHVCKGFSLDIIGNSVQSLHANLHHLTRQTARVSCRDRADACRVCTSAPSICYGLCGAVSAGQDLGGQAAPTSSRWRGHWRLATDRRPTAVPARLSEDQAVAHYAWLAMRSAPPPDPLLEVSLPARSAARFACHGTGPGARGTTCRDEGLGLGRGPNLAVDGTDRRRHRPRAAAMPKDHDSGKKKPHTDDNLLLLNAHPGQVVSLGPPLPGKRHDKQAVEFKCCTKTLAKSHSH